MRKRRERDKPDGERGYMWFGVNGSISEEDSSHARSLLVNGRESFLDRHPLRVSPE